MVPTAYIQRPGAEEAQGPPPSAEEPQALELGEADFSQGDTFEMPATAAASAESEAEAVSEWLAYTTVLLAQAEDTVALEGLVVADFEAEADVELSIRLGERVALLHGVKPPEGWAIALRIQSGGGSGIGKTKGLVPATYVQLVPFSARCNEDYTDAAVGLTLRSGDVVRVLPERSTPDDWWAVGEGGGQGLVAMSVLAPMTADERKAELKEEALKVKRDESKRLKTAAMAAAVAAEVAEKSAAKWEAEAARMAELSDLDEADRARLRREAEEAAAARKEAEVARIVAQQVRCAQPLQVHSSFAVVRQQLHIGSHHLLTEDGQPIPPHPAASDTGPCG